MPGSQTLALLAIALIVSKLLGGLADRVRIPTVLAELVIGIVLGNVGPSLGIHMESSEVVRGLSELGVLFLLFLVGLETDLKEMRKVGVDGALAAIAGVVTPFLLAFLVIPLFFKNFGFERTLFAAAALTATSVGITARVLRDAGKLTSISGRIILSAAVIDDVLGIMVLALVTGIVTSGSLSFAHFAVLFMKIVAFFLVMLFLRHFLLRSAMATIKPLEVSGTVTILIVSLCLLSAWLAERLGLAGIVGAFALGLALDDVHFKGYRQTRHLRLEDLMRPVTDFLAPIFFILMGMSVKFQALMRTDALLLSLILIVCGIAGKLVCGWALRPKTVQAGADRLLVGFGMIPRGEVGLIFAAMGLKMGLLEESHYAAVVLMVIVTTLLAPLLMALRAKSIPRSAAVSGS